MASFAGATLLALATLSTCSCSKSVAVEPRVVSPAPVVMIGEIATVTMGAGDTVLVAIPVVVANGYHVQANPASGEFLIPLTLELASTDAIRFGDPVYPEPGLYRLVGTDEDLYTYHDSVAVTIVVKADNNAEPGESRHAGTLRFQACDARQCLFPSTLPIEITVIIE